MEEVEVPRQSHRFCQDYGSRMKEIVLTLGGNKVPLALPDDPPRQPPKPLTATERMEIEESWWHCHGAIAHVYEEEGRRQKGIS
jgi:hypothetical protein